jgi:hypothetical protein
MAQKKIDLWLVIARKYAEDPVFFSLVPQPVYAGLCRFMPLYIHSH